MATKKKPQKKSEVKSKVKKVKEQKGAEEFQQPMEEAQSQPQTFQKKAEAIAKAKQSNVINKVVTKNKSADAYRKFVEERREWLSGRKK